MTNHVESLERRPAARIAAALAFSAALAAGLAATPAAFGQKLEGANASGKGGPDVTRGATNLPATPPQGAWGEVIMANSRWMVVQNHEGQQFPISVDSITQFLIRWPISVSALTNDSMVEAIGPVVGQEFGSTTVRTDHVDVFEGSDRTLVTPTYTSLFNNNSPSTVNPAYFNATNAFNNAGQNLMNGWDLPVNLGAPGPAPRLHVIGTVVGINPLRLAVPGNNIAASVMPLEAGGLTATQLTRGSTSYAEKGDLVFLMPTELSQKSVILSQVVLYKSIPLREFRAP